MKILAEKKESHTVSRLEMSPPEYQGTSKRLLDHKSTEKLQDIVLTVITRTVSHGRMNRISPAGIHGIHDYTAPYFHFIAP